MEVVNYKMEQVSIDRVIEALKMRDLEEEEIKDFLHDLFDGDEEAKKEPEKEYNDKELNKIKKLLKTYGVDDNEIENFIKDLQETKEEIEDEDDFNYFDSDTMSKLKATEKGKDLIMKAPTMKKEELKKLIGEYLKGE